MAARKQKVRMMKRLSSSISELLNVSKKNLTDDQEDCIPGLHQASLMGNMDLIKMMIRSDTLKLDNQDSKGMTAVHYSCLQPNSEVASLLLQSGARVDVQNHEGDTPTHIACKHSHVDTVSILLYYRSNPTIRNKQGKTAFDLGCEYGKIEIVNLLLDSGIDHSLFAIPSSSRQEIYLRKDGPPLTHGFHLAARNGHVQVLSILVDAGWNPNLMLPTGSALHEAAAQGQIDAVRFLLQAGAEPCIENSFGQTVSDVVKKHGYKYPTVAREIKTLFKECRTAIYGRAIKNHTATSPADLSFVDGEVIWILDRSEEDRWRGTIFGPKFQSRSGYFPASGVQVVDRQTGMQRSLSQRQVKKVGVPTVPEIMNNPLLKECRDGRDSSSSYSSGDSGLTQNSPLRTVPTVRNGDNRGNSASVVSPRHRNSTGSNCSQASSGFESMQLQSTSQPVMNVTVHNLRGDSPPSRNSVHSSEGSSSLGSSLERLDESGYASQVNIAEMILNGVPDSQVLTAWLTDLRYEEYVSLFLTAGYDLATVGRMTPEDLTAIGITKPGHRKRITTEIHKLVVKETWPTIFPKDAWIGAWLNSLNLNEYTRMFECQKYNKVSQVHQLTWEDLEDVGVKKLGHLKKLGLAIKSLRDNRHQMAACDVVSEEPVSSQVILTSRTTAEVRPYALQSTTCTARPTNCMSTFAPNVSPVRRTVSSEGSGYDTFPRRDRNKVPQFTTEVVVHSSSARPTVSVKPQPARSSDNVQNRSIYHGEVDIETIKKQAVQEYLMQQAGLGSASGNYSGVQIPECPIYANFESMRDSGYRAPLSPRLLAGSQSSPLRRKSQPPPPPKRGVTQEGVAMCPLSVPMPYNCVDQLSPSTSMDEFPPPPSPLQCEASIRTLRSVMTSSDMTVPVDGNSSASSTETLAFAQENVGTIKSRSQAGSAHDSSGQRANVKHIFNCGSKGGTLDDIGDMLQNLTDELDAMLTPVRPT